MRKGFIDEVLGFIIVAALIAGGIMLCITISNNSSNTSTVENQKTTTNTPSVTNTPKHIYTGSCTIEGKYRKRVVNCTGDYNPAAKQRAEAKAKECNESSKAVSGCTDTYK